MGSGARWVLVLAVAVACRVPGASQGTKPGHKFGADEVILQGWNYQPVVHFSTVGREVELDVRVLRDGQPYGELTRSDFRLLDGGAPQTISGFNRIARPGVAVSPAAAAPKLGAPAAASGGCAPLAAPQTVVMYLDDVNTAANDLANARTQALAYLDRAQCAGRLPAGERIGVVTGSGYGDLALSASETAVRQALGRVAPHPRSSGTASVPLITPDQAWEIVHLPHGSDAEQLAMAQALKLQVCMPRDCQTYVDARAGQVWGEAEGTTHAVLQLMANAVALLGRQPGRRTLVVTSAGFLTQQLDLQQGQQQVIDAAIQAGVVIDTLDARGLTAPSPVAAAWNDPWISPQLNGWRTRADRGGYSAGDDALADFAHATGGEFLADSNDLRAGYERDVAGPEIYYRLSFSPSSLKDDGAFHALKVTVTAPGHFQVEARKGYFAPTAAQDAGLSAALQQRLITAVTGTTTGGPLDAVVEAFRTSSGVHARVRLNPGTLKLTRKNGRHLDRLMVVVALFTPQGGYLAGRAARVELRLTDASLRYISQPGTGLNVGADLPAAPGNYRLRAVALEPATGAMATMTLLIQVPR